MLEIVCHLDDILGLFDEWCVYHRPSESECPSTFGLMLTELFDEGVGPLNALLGRLEGFLHHLDLSRVDHLFASESHAGAFFRMQFFLVPHTDMGIGQYF